MISLTHCSKLPSEKLSQFEGRIVEYEVQNDSLRITINNQLHCPIRVSVSSSHEDLQQQLAGNFPVTVSGMMDTLLIFPTRRSEDDLQLDLSAWMGDPNATITKGKITLPFPEGYQYKVIQGYEGSFSHDSEYSKYALDFNLSEGDTIVAAADGFVVGVIEGYTENGRTEKWRDYANFITLFHPDMNIYTQYAHLIYNGSLVEVGDSVRAGQAIGLSGATGYAGSPHLHFNVLKPNESGMESTPIEFMEGYKGTDLKKGVRVKK